MRSAVDLPEPDGPTRTVNSPSADVERQLVDGPRAVGEDLADPLEARCRPWLLSSERGRAGARDVIAVPERAALGHAR